MIKKLWGLVILLCGLGVIVGAVAVEIAWLGLCFGTVIVGIMILIFAADLLLLPFSIGFATGKVIFFAGFALMSDDDDDDTYRLKLEDLGSTEKKVVDPTLSKSKWH